MMLELKIPVQVTQKENSDIIPAQTSITTGCFYLQPCNQHRPQYAPIPTHDLAHLYVCMM